MNILVILSLLVIMAAVWLAGWNRGEESGYRRGQDDGYENGYRVGKHEADEEHEMEIQAVSFLTREMRRVTSLN